MALDVRRTLASIYQEQMDESEEEAEQWLKAMSVQGRYQVDVWGN